MIGFIGGLVLGWFIGYWSGFVDRINFNKPYWDWHLEKDKWWKKHVAIEYAKFTHNRDRSKK